MPSGALQPSGYLTATRTSNIVHLWWINPADGKVGDNTRAQVVAWIETDHSKAYVEDAYVNRADVGVVTPQSGQKCLRTYADGKWTDNLLALPRN